MKSIKKILFICFANVGRSQMAEGFYGKLRGRQYSASAGVEDYADKYGGKPAQRIIELMSEKGIDISTHFIKQVTPQMIDLHDNVVVLCSQEQCPDFLASKHPKVLIKTVKDPYQLELDQMRNIRDQISSIVHEVDQQVNVV